MFGENKSEFAFKFRNLLGRYYFENGNNFIKAKAVLMEKINMEYDAVCKMFEEEVKRGSAQK